MLVPIVKMARLAPVERDYLGKKIIVCHQNSISQVHHFEAFIRKINLTTKSIFEELS